MVSKKAKGGPSKLINCLGGSLAPRRLVRCKVHAIEPVPPPEDAKQSKDADKEEHKDADQKQCEDIFALDDFHL